MKALVLRKHGTLDELQVVTDYPRPQAAEGHVVIRVRASSFNYHDVFTVRGDKLASAYHVENWIAAIQQVQSEPAGGR